MFISRQTIIGPWTWGRGHDENRGRRGVGVGFGNVQQLQLQKKMISQQRGLRRSRWPENYKGNRSVQPYGSHVTYLGHVAASRIDCFLRSKSKDGSG